MTSRERSPAAAPKDDLAKLSRIEVELVKFIETNEQEQRRKKNQREGLDALIRQQRDNLIRLESDDSPVIKLDTYRTLRRQLRENRATLAKVDEDMRVRAAALIESKAHLVNVRDTKAAVERDRAQTATLIPFRRR